MVLAEPGRELDGAGALSPGLCHISMVFVDPGLWGRRIGESLLEGAASAAVARDFDRLQLWTGAGNTRARNLYERTGFEPSGRTASLASGELILHYVRRLDLRH